MSDRCLFCGRELTWLQKKKLYCGNTDQTLCGDCYGRYKSLSAVERAEAAIQTGRAKEGIKLKEYLDAVHEAQQQKEAQKAERERSRVSQLHCIRCNEPMSYYGPLTFKLGEETYFFSDLNRLMSGSIAMDVYRCGSCGKVEFFIPDGSVLEALTETRREDL